jgi:hypothetical protein
MRLIECTRKQIVNAFGKPEQIKVVKYEARFWEGPLQSGDKGRYVTCECNDVFMRGKFLKTAPSVTYYGKLLAAVSRI